MKAYSIIVCLFVSSFMSCESSLNSKQNGVDSTSTKEAIDSSKITSEKKLKAYDDLVFLKEETLTAGPGTKSVLFNPQGDKLYALNLEALSISEFDQKTKKVLRTFKFKATPARGWDYATHRSISSYEEKPVEGAFSHNGNILWVSLHNGDGIVPIHLLDGRLSATRQDPTDKEMYIQYPENGKTDTVYVPLIKTGKTPKVIASTADSKNLLVSNWHSLTVSVLEIDEKQYPFGKIIKDINVGAIPRGIVIDEKNKKSYIAIMGASRINVIDNQNWEPLQILQIPSNPRHILEDNQGRLFVSYNSLGQVACIDAQTGKTLFKAPTKAQPRTIQLSKNKKFLFVTCYKGNILDVFKIHEDRFEHLYTLPSKGSPVGVDVYEDDEIVQVWVCNYVLGNVKVFDFDKK